MRFFLFFMKTDCLLCVRALNKCFTVLDKLSILKGAGMKKVLLIYTYAVHEKYVGIPSVNNTLFRVPKLGLQYLAAVLMQKGVGVEILDQSIVPFTCGQLVDYCKNGDFYMIGFYTSTLLKKKVISYIKSIRGAGINLPIVVGGPGFFGYKDYLQGGCDIVCHGEGEKTILEILNFYKGDRKIEAVKGISYVKDGKIFVNPPQDTIMNLDELPFPYRKADEIYKYYNYHIFGMRQPYTTMLASRGCRGLCTFCASANIWGRHIRRRSPENIIDEVDFLVKKMGIRYIGFQDDTFTIDFDWVERICELLIKRRYDLYFSCISNVLDFKKNKEKKLDLLKKAGCNCIFFGLQAVNKQIIKNIKRSTSEPEDLVSTVQIARKKGILTFVSFIFGLPEESIISIKEDIDYVIKTKPNIAQFCILAPLEGSELFQQYRDGQICKVSSQELKKWRLRGFIRFYFDPKILWNNLTYIFTKNPRWLCKGIWVISYPFIMIKNFLLKKELNQN